MLQVLASQQKKPFLFAKPFKFQNHCLITEVAKKYKRRPTHLHPASSDISTLLNTLLSNPGKQYWYNPNLITSDTPAFRFVCISMQPALCCCNKQVLPRWKRGIERPQVTVPQTLKACLHHSMMESIPVLRGTVGKKRSWAHHYSVFFLSFLRLSFTM